MSARVHLWYDGDWQTCRDAACDMDYHLPMGVAKAKALPLPFVEAVLGPIGGVGAVSPYKDALLWFDEYGSLHRDYDMPAVVGINENTGYLAWYRHGRLSRRGSRPNVIHRSGVQMLYKRGHMPLSTSWGVVEEPRP